MTKPEEKKNSLNKIKKVKKLLDEVSSATRLHDFVVEEINELFELSSKENLSIQSVQQPSQDEIVEKISESEIIANDIVNISCCVAYWAKPEHRQILQKLVTRPTDKPEKISGLKVTAALQRYLAIFQIYSAGIAAIDGQRYDSLFNIFYAKKIQSNSHDPHEFLVDLIGEAINTVNDSRIFNNFKEFNRHYFAMSEHLYKVLQQPLNDLIFIGDNYDAAFDEFEVLLALVVADRKINHEIQVYDLQGRFAGKHIQDQSPLKRIIREAKANDKNWEPLKQGFFNKDFERFIKVAEDYEKMISNNPRS